MMFRTFVVCLHNLSHLAETIAWKNSTINWTSVPLFCGILQRIFWTAGKKTNAMKATNILIDDESQ